MRLLRSRLFGALALAAAGPLTPLVAGQSQPVTFTDRLDSGAQPPVFSASEVQTFNFIYTQGIQVSEVALLDSEKTIVASATQGGNGMPTVSPSTEGAYGLSLYPSAGAATITVNSTSLSSDKHGTVLYFRVEWTESAGGRNTSGYVYSRDFVYSSPADTSSTLGPLVSATTAAFPVTTFPSSAATTAIKSSATAATTVTSGTSGTSATSAKSTTTTAASSAVKPSKTDDSSGAINPGGAKVSGGKKSLSGGAIAGIVVGVVAALAIVGGLVFFFYRRRAHSTGRLPGSVEPYRGSGSEQIGLQSGFASAAAVEKDGIIDGDGPRFGNNTNGGPHSPYSDDDGAAGVGAAARTGQAGSAGTSRPATAALAANLSSPASPASAAAQPATAAAAAATAATAAAATPKPAVSEQVAALIEENMTADDVARLEAEERELDAAIENAMRNRHNAISGQP